MEAGARLLEVSVGGLQRGDPPLRPGPWIADTPAAGGELSGVDADIPLEAALRHGVPVCGAALHSPAVARLDRLPRRPGRVHAKPRDRLLREQPPRHVRAAAVRDPEPEGFRWLRRVLLGAYGERRARPGPPPHRRCRAPLLRPVSYPHLR